jgi:tyrocidine synthetase-3
MLKDTKAPILIKNSVHESNLTESLDDLEKQPVLISLDDANILDGFETSNLDVVSSPEDTAYVIYTSGTTGQPKGVLVAHKAVVSFAFENSYMPEKAKKVASLAPYSFDGFVFDIFYSLLNGASVYLLDKSLTLDIDGLCSYLKNNEIDSFFTTTALFNQLVKSDQLQNTKVRNLLFGGEKADLSVIQYCLEKLNSINLVHVYGPTETVVFASAYHFEGVTTDNAPIGKPLNNKRFYVLDKVGNIVPVGCSGELYIGGAGLAKGYLNQPELTEEKFIKDTFASQEQIEQGEEKLYRTGDLVRWLPDGNIEFLGRIDSQIKLRGYRIELGEIESAINELPEVKQAVVVDFDKDGNKYLAAYVVLNEGENFSADELSSKLALDLPEYMVPSTFMALEFIPLTINGKLDRKALPNPEFNSEEDYVAPTTGLEQQLCNVWEEVLGVEKVGIKDNFFQLGGNSIKAIQLSAVSRKTINVDLPLVLLFTHKTIARIVNHLSSDELTFIPKEELDVYPLSFAQERLLFIERFEEGTAVYHIPYFVELNQGVNLNALEAAFTAVIERHPILKTVYRTDENGNDQQIILDTKVEIENQLVSNKEEALKAAQEEIGKPFDLTVSPSIRLNKYESEDTHYLLILWHHIAFDGWSTDIFLNELTIAYNALDAGEEVDLPALDVNYADYAVWQRDFLKGENLNELLTYWERNLSGHETLNLPTDYRRPLLFDYKGKDYFFELDIELSNQLRELAKSEETTLYTVLLSGFYLALTILSGQSDLIIGTPSDNRSHAQTQALVGFFVNSLALRLEIDAEKSLVDLINQVSSVIRQAKINQELPFEKLVDHLNLERDASRHPLFQIMFSLQSFGEMDENATSPFSPISVNEYSELYSPAKYDLSLFLSDQQEVIKGEFNYASSLFDESTIERTFNLFKNVLKALVTNKEQPINEVNLLSSKERNLLVSEWNQTSAFYPTDKTFHELFEEQVTLNPKGIAVVHGDTELSYLELNEKANQLARLIRLNYKNAFNEELKAGTFIALYLDRGVETVVSILAVLKSGVAYVPISPEYPASRISFMLEDTQAPILLKKSENDSNLNESLESMEQKPMLISLDDSSLLDEIETTNLSAVSKPNDLAYVIYTSGTTGQPKGVLVEHKAVVSFAYENTYMPEKAAKVASLAPYSFDGFVFDTFYSLLNGASVYLLDKSLTLDISALCSYLKNKEIDSFFTTTALFNQLVKSDELQNTKVRNLLFGGENADISVVQYCLDNLASINLVHVYGPTETVVFASAFHFEGNKINNAPIGKPLNNKRFYVLDKAGNIVPVGSPGELLIGGAGIARGYLNQPELTDEKFINDPFASQAQIEQGEGRLYRTGDVVRWLSNGNIEFIGRIDKQVKIRGHRIELGEIEAVLKELPEIKEAVVVDLRLEDNHFLATYFVTEKGQEITKDELRSRLSNVLPDYMVPSAFTALDSIPLTLNGKLDRSVLPTPEFSSTKSYIAPSTELEAKLCEVWASVLGQEKVGIHDNFFHIGGNSINAIKITAGCRKSADIDLSISRLFQFKTIAKITQELEFSEEIVIPKSTEEKPVLSFAQERLLFIERFQQGSDVYHIPYLTELKDGVDSQLLEKAFNEIVNRHPVLKTVYRTDTDGKDYQFVLEEDVQIQRGQVENREALDLEISEEIARPFNLETEPSIRLYEYKVEDKNYLLILWHHIAFDGWSTDIFLNEFHAIYDALNNEKAISLPSIDISYIDYAAWQRSYLHGETLDKLTAYWSANLSGYETFNLPTDFDRPRELDYIGKDYEFDLSSDLSEKLRSLAKEEEVTLYTVLLSAYYIMLSTLSGQSDILIGTPSDNRPHLQTQSLIGFFINSLPLRAEIIKENSISEFINQVNKVVIDAKTNQELPLEKIMEKLKVERDASRHPLFQVLFSLQDFGSDNGLNQNLPFTPVDLKENAYSPARYDLNLIMSDNETLIKGGFNYAVSLFEESTVQRMHQIFVFVLEAFIDNSQQAIVGINKVSVPERKVLLEDWNKTEGYYPNDRTLQEVFEKQVLQNPDAIALVYGVRTLTYNELNNKANQLARLIRSNYEIQFEKTLSPGTFIALYLDRSADVVISILAVLKAGGTYVPLSPKYPIERTKFILDDTGAEMLLLQQEQMTDIFMSGWLSDLNVMPSLILVDDEAALSQMEEDNLPLINESKDLAYVIYTSGTTGQPKGVLVDHEAVISFAYDNDYVATPAKKVASLSPYSFDGFVFDAFYSLLNGASVYLVDKSLSLNIEELCGYLEKHRIDTFFTTTALFNLLIKSDQLKNTEVRNILFGGEKADLSVIQQALNDLSSINLVHVYGPTETVVYASAYHFKGTTTLNAPIGSPLKNKRFYVLDESSNIVPIGCIGELYIGGAGVAKGYLNQPELTAKSFVVDPFATEEDKSKGRDRLYKTGDLVRWLANGAIEFVGRVDSQVKIRGHRIELGEIESVLNSFEEVANAVVIDLVKEGAKYLAAYVVLNDSASTTAENLRAKLSSTLPDYMVPNTFTSLEAIPLSINGKLDRRALPDPEFSSEGNYVSPRTKMEEQLCEIWEEILGQDQIGIYDNFFHIGGDSIVAIRVISKAKTLGLSFSVQDLFSSPNIATLSKQVQLESIEEEAYQVFSLISEDQASVLDEAFKDNLTDAFPATHLQMGMLLESKLSKGTYHDVINYQVKMAFDEDRFNSLLQELVDGYEILRTGFLDDDTTGYLAFVLDETLAKVQVINKTLSEEQIIEIEHTKSFDFSSAGLYRFLISDIQENSFLMTFSLHHAIIDGWSEASIVSQFIEAYTKDAELTVSNLSLPSYGEFVRNEQFALNDTGVKSFWAEYLAGYEAPDFPLLKTPISSNGQEGEPMYVLNTEDSKIVLDIAVELGITVDSIFLALYHHVMCLFQSTEDYTIGLVVNNRLEKEGGDQMCGLFLNTIPFRPAPNNEEKTFYNTLKHIANEKIRVSKYKRLPYGFIKTNWLTEANHYQCAFNYIHFHNKTDTDELSNQKGDAVLGDRTGVGRINIPVAFTVLREKDDFSLILAVNEGSMDIPLMEQFWTYLIESVHTLVNHKDELKQKKLLRLNQQDAAKIENWNLTDQDFTDTKTLHQLFEKQVLDTPDAVALVFENKELSFGELNEKSNQLAHCIRDSYQETHNESMQPDTLVALFFERGIEMVVAILAVLKAGGAYLPISPEYPQKRISFIVEDSNAALVITEKRIQQKITNELKEGVSPIVLTLEELSNQSYSTANVDLESSADNLAYVIYTSGTTGNPKGVMVEHKSAVHLVEHVQKTHLLKPETKALFFSDYVFDASVYELFPNLLVGAQTFIASQTVRKDGHELLNLINKNEITKAFIPTILMNTLDEQLANSSLKVIHTGGDKLKKLEHLNSKMVFNQYGPTEATVMVTQNQLSNVDDVNIGKAISNTRLYVVDKSGDEVPVGSPGELHISGVSLARGYWNRPELNAERFVENKLATPADLEKGYSRVFKTGDMVRFLPDGSLDFLGRLDHQVKIQGYRIELEEIENTLKSISGIEEAVVIDKEKDGTKYIAAYVIGVGGDPIDLTILRDQLTELLPEYMMPSSFIEIDEIPLTINGKLDRKALPQPTFINEESYVAPSNSLEEKLAKIWQEVLGIEKVGVKDNFFSIGGNSINAIQLTAASRKQQQIDIPIALLFKHKTIEKLAQYLTVGELLIIPKSNKEKNPLSFAQERLLFIERFEEGTNVYHIPYFAQLKTSTDLDLLEQAFNTVIDRHSVLKSVYKTDENGDDYQIVLNQKVALEQSEVENREEVKKRVNAEINLPFDLTSEPGIRLRVYDDGATKHLLILWHHIVFDGWSANIFITELFTAYEALVSGKKLILPELEISYADYANWQREYLQDETLDQLVGYWSETLGGFETLNLPTDYARPKQLDYIGSDFSFELDADLSSKLRRIANEEETTLYTVLLSAYYVMLASVSGQSDLLIGTPSDNRSHAQVQELIGFFVNSLPLRAQVLPEESISGLIKEIHTTVTQAKIHQDLPLEKMVDKLKVERDASRHPLFQVIFSLQDIATDEDENEDVPFEPAYLEEGKGLYSPARYDLSLLLTDDAAQIGGVFNYATSLFDQETIARMAAIYHKVLAGFAMNKEQSIAEIDKLSDEDSELLLDVWNQSDADYPTDKTLNALFEECVTATPNEIAVVHGKNQLTYSELNSKANQLARVIRSNYKTQHNKELSPGIFVALYLDRSIETLVSIFAVLKAGATYVPISTEYPIERTKFILEDTQSAILLLQQDSMATIFMEGWLSELSQMPGLILVDDENTFVDVETSNLEQFSCANDLAYVIYTSGTTGQPKGVLVEHTAVVSFAYENKYISNSAKKIASFSPYSFDGFVFDTFYSLLNGASVYLLDKSLSLDIEGLCRYLALNKIDSFFTTTALFNQLVKSDQLKTTKINNILFGGEKADLAVIQYCLKELSSINLVHVYGPTETVVYASAYHFNGKYTNNAPIGSPLNNKRFYVLDSSKQIVPVGCPGELYIGGAGIARGYLNQVDLTNDRFVNDPFATESQIEKGQTRLYRTGDLVRWLPDGNIEFVGRIDNQVKIRGHRIELGEIESVLNKLSHVEDAVVIDIEKDGIKSLAAYVVFNEDEQGQLESLRIELGRRLPDYMVPNTFTEIEKVPLTINGKLDRRALPDPEFVSGDSYVAPSTELEKQLCAIWQEVLGQERVGGNDNFFHIGGDSIVAIRVISKAKTLGLYFSVQNLFTAPTIADLTQYVKRNETSQEEYESFSLLNSDQLEGLNESHPNNLMDAFPATHLQMGMLLESKLEVGTYHDVISYQVNVSFEQTRFRQLLQELVNRYEILRTGFAEDKKAGYIAFVLENSEPHIEFIDGKTVEKELINIEHTKSFDFSEAGLYRFVISDIEENSFLMTFSLHHAIIDGWSEASLVAQLIEAYVGGLDSFGETLPLPSFGEFVRNEQAALNDPEFKAFWSEYLKGYESPEVQLVVKSNSNDAEEGEPFYDLTKEESKIVLDLASELGITVDSVFLALYQHVLCLFQNTKDYMVGLVVNNRLEKEGGDQLCGLFLNTIPFRPASFEGDENVFDWIKHIANEKNRVLKYKALPYGHIKSQWLTDTDSYQCAFNYIHFHNKASADELSNETGDVVLGKRSGIGRINIPIAFTVYREKDEFSLGLMVNKGSIDISLMKQFWKYLTAEIQSLVTDKQVLLQTPLLNTIEEDANQIQLFNQTKVDFPRTKTVSALFEEQVLKSPDSVAIVKDGESQTYSELNAKANQLASVIRARYTEANEEELPEETFVALYFTRSIDMLVGILAVLKAGGAYVPISPEYPTERISYMLSDTKAPIVLTNADTEVNLNENVAGLIDAPLIISINEPNLLAGVETSNLELNILPESLAYVIYTSGTTGKPKGVLVEHKAIVSFAHKNDYIRVPAKRVASLAPYSFDGFVFDAFYSLLNGASVHLLDKSLLLNMNELCSYFTDNEIDSFFTTTALFNQLVKSGELNKTKIQNILFGGEKASVPTIQQGLQEHSSINFIHVYGPTETVVFASAYHFSHEQIDAAPIGKPLNNKRFYVLNTEGNNAPVGSPGELYIGGAGMARGYLNLPELTSDRFINDPFATAEDVQNNENRLYRTGDIVRWLPDGNIEFIGRVDKQVKIRGHRIELGEIENVLIDFNEVKEVAVVDLEKEGGKYLSAYVVADGDEPLNLDSIREELLEKLPDYMVPDSFTELKSIPLNINGKLDRKALPDTEFSSSENYVAARTKLEKQLCLIWEEVLDIEQIGVNDNFFHIGGNSINAIQLTSTSRKNINLDIPIATLFKYKTIAKIATQLDQQELLVIPKSTSEQLPLSFAQERLFFIEQFEEGTSAYHVPYFVKIDPETDFELLEKSFQIVIDRHSVLTSAYKTNEEGAHYQEQLDVKVPVQHYNANDKAELIQIVKAEIEQHFDLINEPSIRLFSYDLEDEKYMLIVWHHIAFDGWSTNIFFRELFSVYNSLSKEEPIQLPELDISYADYSAWQRDFLQGDTLDRLVHYWQTNLDGYETLNLPTDFARPQEIDYTGRDFMFELNAELSGELRNVAKEKETTLYTVLLSAFYVTLYNLSGQSDLLIGTPSDNRSHAQTQTLVGFFVNSLPLRVQIEKEKPLLDLIDAVHEVVVQAKIHQELPFEKLVDSLSVERDSSRNPLFQIMFSLQDFDQRGVEDEVGPFEIVNLTEEQSLVNAAKYDLSLALTSDSDKIAAGINYAVSLFNEATIERISEMYQAVLEAFVKNKNQSVAAVKVLSKSEESLILNDWNNTDVAFPDQVTLPALFEETVAKNPSQIALVFGDESITYSELNDRANQLAHFISTTNKQQADPIIALYLDRGIEMIVSIMAVLKSGAAYVPISPEYPESRVQYLLGDTKATIILSDNSSKDKLATCLEGLSQLPVVINVDDTSYQEESTKVNFSNNCTSRDLAYVIYTSGTTGKPKGVMVEHRSLVNLVECVTKTHELEPGTKSLFFSDYVFDASVYELFPRLIAGAQIFIASKEVREEPDELLKVINENEIKNVFVPTALLNILEQELSESTANVLHTGGDTLKKFTDLPAQKVFNQYGPTEATVMVTQNQLESGSEVGIGKPIQNTRLYVLTEEGNLATIGCPGILYIGGAVLARGYLNRPELTDKTFIENAFATPDDIEKGYTKLYNSGDLVRWLADGSLEFLGRKDNQVKIRGYRIELGEIESKLLELEAVDQAAVIDWDNDGIKHIAAYIVSDSAIDSEGVKKELESVLPKYMVPETFTQIDKIPWTLSDKLDRKALPEPKFELSDNYVAPSNELEELLSKIWAEVLGLEKVGVNDNFFHIGGDSIISIQLVSKLRKAGITLQVKSIFAAPTILQLAELISKLETECKYVTEQGILEGSFDLLPIQKWFFQQDFETANHWNQAFMMKIPGDVEISAVEKAITSLTEQHDMLRSSFTADEQDLSQAYNSNVEQAKGVFNAENISGLDEMQVHNRLTELQAQFDITDGPLWQVTHLSGYEDGSARLFFAFHHLIIDVVSWRIIVEDMQALILGEELPEKTSSYRQWVNTVSQYEGNQPTEKEYWNNVLSDQVIETPTENQENSMFKLSSELTNVLLQEANQGYNTEINDLLLSALSMALSQTFNRSINHITLEGHGRESIDDELDLSSTVGWFTTVYPVKLEKGQDVEKTIILTKEMLRSIPNKGIGFGAISQDDSTALNSIGFNYLGQLDNNSAKDKEQLWQIVSEDVGAMIPAENKDDLVINMTGMVQNGQLQFSIASRLSKRDTQILTTSFEKALIAVVEQGQKTAIKGGVKTPSDYGLKDLSMAHLSRLHSKFNAEDNKEERENILEF